MLPSAKPPVVPKVADIDEPKPSMSPDDIKSFNSEIRKVSSSSSTKNLVRDLEQERKREKFNLRIHSVLEKLDHLTLKDDNDRLNKLFLFVMQTCNDIVGPIAEPESFDLCVSLLKQFFDNEEIVTKQVMHIILPQIKKLTMYRKSKHSVLRMFAVFFSWISRKTT